MSHVCRTVKSERGTLAEQFIGQHLVYRDPGKPTLHLWLREGRANNTEVDYVIADGPIVVPVGVKAGARGTLKSLHQFALEKKARRAVRFDLSPPARFKAKARSGDAVEPVQFQLVSLPLYAVESLQATDRSED